MKTMRDPSAKPYCKCLSCQLFRNTCGGRPTRGYDLQNWCEYMRDVRDHFHLTNAYIAKEADVSIKTIERIMAINCDQDIMRATARRIELVVIGQVGEHTCYLDHNNSETEQIAALHAEIATLHEAVAFLKKENDRKAKIIDKYLDN